MGMELILTSGAGLTLTYTRSSPPGVIVVPLMLIGIGVGCIFQPTLVALQAHSPKSRRAVIISNRNFFRCAGGAVGLAVSASVLQSSLRSRLPSSYAYLADSTYALPSAPALPEGGSAISDWEGVLDAYMYGSRAVFLLQVPLIGVCLLGCLLVRDRGLEPIDDTLPEEQDGEADADAEKRSSLGSHHQRPQQREKAEC
jgi:hypothetical protein